MTMNDKLGLESSFFFDLPNFLVCVLAVLILSNLFRLPRNYILLLLAHCFIPFFLNDVLFPTSYMPDQYRYTAAVMELRGGVAVTEHSTNVINASWLLAFIPLPFIETAQSLGFFNKLLFILMFFFLYQKKVLNRFSAYFLLLYPSVILYTGLGLRDPLIFYCMMLIAYFAIKRNFVLMIVFLSPLYFIKFQNFFLMLPLFSFIFFHIYDKGMSVRKGLVILVISAICLVLSFPVVAPLINKLRMSMSLEDGNLGSEAVPMITTISDFLYLGITSGLYFFAKPFPWEASNTLQLVQVFENLIIMLIVIKLTAKAWSTSKSKLVFWLLLLISSLSIYGLVVFNYGTAARYRFPFIAMYVVYVTYSLNISQIFNRKIKI